MFYSAKNNAWYDPSFRSSYEKTSAWPGDAVEYPRSLFNEVVTNRPSGKVMQPDENGYPILVDLTPSVLSEEQLQAEAKFYLSSTDWYVTRKMETGKEIPEEISTKRAEARDLLK